MTSELNEINDNDIMDLLEALESMEIATPKPISPHFPQWIYSETTIKCMGCGRVYSGVMEHFDNSPYLNSTILWCPNCVKENEAKWWKGCLRMENVIEIV